MITGCGRRVWLELNCLIIFSRQRCLRPAYYDTPCLSIARAVPHRQVTERKQKYRNEAVRAGKNLSGKHDRHRGMIANALIFNENKGRQTTTRFNQRVNP
jgi:hypothetical protein